MWIIFKSMRLKSSLETLQNPNVVPLFPYVFSCFKSKVIYANVYQIWHSEYSFFKVNTSMQYCFVQIKTQHIENHICLSRYDLDGSGWQEENRHTNKT